MGGLPSPEDVRQLLGPPKQTALPFNNVNQAVNPAAQSVPKSEEERALQKNWPMFPRGPLRDYLDGFVRMHNRPPGIEGLRLIHLFLPILPVGYGTMGFRA
ncbi:unnamed protein product [Clonostachys rosea f. rosea IK726]|uniref:Uncharacterized protein n=1 Tax=Clonostachys rosea f. rosea IK726 TaxID=1349383 RepID=A0ACA9UMM9_BIOOC|nr:unnamed protein product [Clonostachys rosea f. rosea IK726]